MKKLIISFKMGDANFEVEGQRIVLKMTGNPNFTSLSALLKVVTDNLAAYSDALSKAGRNQPKENTVLKNQARKDLENSLKQLGISVMQVAAGDVPMLASSGFRLYKDRQPRKLFDKPKTVAVVQGPNSGSIKVTVNKIEAAQFYEFQIAPNGQNGNTVWQSVQETKRVAVITGLTSGVQYRVRVAAAGASNARVWSDEVLIYVS